MMQKNEKIKTWIFFDHFILFFWLKPKEPKVQDLDLFAKKLKFLKKTSKLGRTARLFAE
ncbi:hypothetical protein FIC_00323 [Flavobacteriaceae bacterium 3519-10]|nr:hypothetical protein FIC_00323 [Flavobacteriaceae bacterium 3519-10]